MSTQTTTMVAEVVELHPPDRSSRDEEAVPPRDHPTPSSIIAPLEITTSVKVKIFSAAFCFFNAGINDGSLGALIPYFLRHYGISTGWMAIPYGISFVGWLVAAAIIPYIRLSFGAGGVILAGASLQFISQLLRFWTPPFGVLALSFFPVCLGQGLQDSQANTFASGLKNAHRWLGVIHGSYAVGCLCGPLIASAIASNSGGDWALFYHVPVGIGALNLAICGYAFRDETTFWKAGAGGAERRSAVALGELRGAVKQKSVWLLSLFFFFYIGAALTTGGWIVEYLVVVRKGRLSQVGYISAAFNGGTALGRFLLAEPTFRFGEKRMLVGYSVLALALQIVFWRVPNIVVDAVTVSFLGFLLGPFFATGVSVGSKLIPPELQQSGLALIFVMAQAGGAVFPAITGVIASEAGVGSLQPMLVGLLAAMGISWLFIPNPKTRHL